MIVVTTPTGQIGHAVVQGLLAERQSVRVIARNPAALPDGIAENVEVFAGSHGNPEVAMAAYEGADAVLHITPPDVHAANVRSHYRGFAAASAAAITATGVKRAVVVSTLGRGYTAEAGHLSAALEAEGIINATGVHTRSLAMPFFMDNLLNHRSSIKDHGILPLPNEQDKVLLTVATPDIARVAVGLLTDRTWTGQESLPVVGPDLLTPRKMAGIISDSIGRPVHFAQVSSDTYRSTLLQYGMSEGWVQGLADMGTAQNNGIYDVQVRDPHRVTETSFAAWVETTLKPAL
ncbi:MULTISPECIES: NmrA family NAD(P)-binding protein [unclassified Arthrobacter]|uniref:NmrA family NAD(P)-binding protein n=1 Tax=unclassified Arthrobacter TaxID=235627 RepID=UPI001D135D99|nr:MULTISPECIES: NAD(P)H-binding protein [unclassified Arthrobacter]MCC3274854.1 NAD(P)H-binding protein [Arthrobacter sp. zg-Y20]MCC9177552.1 NAD(P)H-binding protein [Arthrobacter sp. zg-Y750]MDK1315010.1 NAD(P)H-binding protein [Arthrobacter sp. zg.Y20]WIB04860.1 NAD(P)H-binding protein [Arthrobacter sp. zg-Y20]